MPKRMIAAILSLFLTTVSLAQLHLAQLQNSKSRNLKRIDGSTITPAEIDRAVTRLMRTADVTGIAIAILNDGQVAYLKAYGVRDKEKKLALTPNSVMYAASFTKVAFAYMVMQLVDEGVLDLDKPVYQYLPKALPEYDDYKDLANDQRYQRITARMLLSHTSGFPNWRRLTDDGKLSINFEPGSRFAYSGEGIALLQLVVESATKKPLDALMRDRVFQPLGMTRSSMVWEDRFESDYANGYDEQEHSLGPQKLTRADAAGSMQTTLTDFGHFMEAVMQGKGLRQETREQMLSSQIPILSKHEFPTLSTETTGENKAIRLSYGLGWGLYWTPYGKAFFKEGHLEGWRHDVVCFDKPGTGIVIMTNSSKRRKPLQSTPRNLAQQYLHTDRVGRVHAIQFSEVRRPLPGLRDAKSGGNHCRRNRWRCNPSHEARKVPLPAETRLAVSGALQNPGFRSWCSFTTQTTKP